jgi:hypothetical protein
MEFVATGAWILPYLWNDTEKVQWENCPDGRGACNTRSSDLEWVCGQTVLKNDLFLQRVALTDDRRSHFILLESFTLAPS